MIEGTRMSVVFGLGLRKIIDDLATAAAEAGSDLAEVAKKWTLGVVYTPYSPSNGIKYLRDSCGFEVKLSKTGVKYVHHNSCLFDFGRYKT